MKLNIKNIVTKNKTTFFYLLIIICAIFYFSLHFKTRENFTWTQKSTDDFLKIERHTNPNNIFDVNLLQQENNISQEEVNYFIENQKWEWTNETQELYKKAIRKNPYVRTHPQDSLNYAMTIYDEVSILKILSNLSKEGDFLLNGVLVPTRELYPSGFGDFGYNSGLLDIDNKRDIIKCNVNTNQLERISYTKKYGIFGEKQQKTTHVNYCNLEKIIPGFSFIDKPCEPCTNIDDHINDKCKFRLKTKKHPFISDVWKYIWFDDNKIQDMTKLNDNSK